MSDSGVEAGESPPPQPPNPNRSDPPPDEGASQPGGHDRANEVFIAVRNGLKLGGSLLVTWGVAMIVRLQIPAHLGPIRQGHFAFSESFTAIFFSFLSFGIETHIIKEVAVRPQAASEFVGGIFAIRAVLACLLMTVMGVTLTLTGRSDEILNAAMTFGLCYFLLGINATLASVLQAVSRVGRLAVVNVVSKLVWGAGVLLGLYYDVQLWMLAGTMVVSEALKTTVLIPAATAAADLRYRVDLRAAWKAVRASVPFFVNGIAITFGSSLGVTTMGFIRHDEREVGWFAACQNIAGLAMLLQPLLVWVVMPMLSRAHARSPKEMHEILRRAVEGLLIVITPATVFISAGSDFLVNLAFGEEYAPASLGLSILSLVFVMVYLNYMVASALVLSNRGWTVTVISIISVCFVAALMLICVPLGRTLWGTGGECAGAAVAVVTSEAFVVAAMLHRSEESPLDARNLAVLAKCVGSGIVVLVVNHLLRDLGPPRLAVVVVLYVVLALALRVIRLSDLRRVVDVIRARRRGDTPTS